MSAGVQCAVAYVHLLLELVVARRAWSSCLQNSLVGPDTMELTESRDGKDLVSHHNHLSTKGFGALEVCM